MSLSESDIRSYWEAAESLVAAGAAICAINLLDALLAAPVPSSMILEEITTRVRAADLALSEQLHPDVARRIIEPAIKLFDHFSVSAELKVNVLKIMSIVARRRSQYAQSVAFLQQCSTIVEKELNSSGGGVIKMAIEGDDSSPSASRRRRVEAAAPRAVVKEEQKPHGPSEVLEKLQCLILLELSRTHYARVLDSQFSDMDAIAQMEHSTARYASFAQSPALYSLSATLCVTHIFSLLLQSQLANAILHLKEAEAMFGHCPEFSALLALVETLHIGGCGIVADSSKRERVSSSSIPQHSTTQSSSMSSFKIVNWLSEGSVRILSLFLELLRRAGSSSHGDLASSLKDLTNAVEEQMRSLTALKRQVSNSASSPSGGALLSATTMSSSSSSAAAVNSEIRFLVGVKVAAYVEVILADLTRLDVVGALRKLEPLCSYLLMFRQHTIHYRAHIHLVIAALTICLFRSKQSADQAVEACMEHLTAAEQAGAEGGTVLTARLLRALVYQNLLKEAASNTKGRASMSDQRRTLESLLEQLQVSFDQSNSGQKPPWALRHRALFSVITGASALDVHDYPKAVQVLKSATEQSKQVFGLQNPTVCQSLRLLSLGHSLAGAEEQAEIALTTASQLANKCSDEHTMIHCLQWTLSHLIVITDNDRRLQTQLQSALTVGMEKLQHQFQQVSQMPEWSAVTTFLPERQDYSQWLAKTLHHHQAAPRSSTGKLAAGTQSTA